MGLPSCQHFNKVCSGLCPAISICNWRHSFCSRYLAAAAPPPCIYSIMCVIFQMPTWMDDAHPLEASASEFKWLGEWQQDRVLLLTRLWQIIGCHQTYSISCSLPEIPPTCLMAISPLKVLMNKNSMHTLKDWEEYPSPYIIWTHTILQISMSLSTCQ